MNPTLHIWAQNYENLIPCLSSQKIIFLLFSCSADKTQPKLTMMSIRYQTTYQIKLQWALKEQLIKKETVSGISNLIQTELPQNTNESLKEISCTIISISKPHKRNSEAQLIL